MNSRYNGNKLYSQERYEYLQKLNKRKQRRRIKVIVFFAVLAVLIVAIIACFKHFTKNDDVVAVTGGNLAINKTESASETPSPTESSQAAAFHNIYYATYYASIYGDLGEREIWLIASIAAHNLLLVLNIAQSVDSV